MTALTRSDDALPCVSRALASALITLCLLASPAFAVDDDGDGLDNAVETNTGVYVSPSDTGTDPNDPDTDGDGFQDGDEVGLGSDPVDSADPPFHHKLTAGDPANDDQFGYSVSLSGDTVLIGTPDGDDDGGDPNTGAAYVFTRSGGVWTQEAKLTASDAVLGDRFGSSVSLSGDTALIGAPQEGDTVVGSFFVGSVYVFTRAAGVWTQRAKLRAGDPEESDLFGISVALAGNTAIIGAEGGDDVGLFSDSGAAYVFTGSGSSWTQQAKLTADDASANSRFGGSVALSADGDTAVIGASFPGLPPPEPQRAGSAYVFTRSGTSWSQQDKLVASDGADGDQFAWRVSIAGDTALIGADQDDDGGSSSGSAYVFTRTGTSWSEEAKLTASDATADARFGSGVSISGDTAWVGAFQGGGGAVYAFTRSGSVWTERTRVVPIDTLAGDHFGWSVAYAGGTAVIGARRDGDLVTDDSGSAYVYDVANALDDPDADGLPNITETDTGVFVDAFDTGTDPLVADTDGDGLLDGVETNTGVFVDASDTGTNPHVADTDGDGLLDGFEVANGFDPVTPGEQNLDGDGDGLDNLAEQAEGTDPGDPDSDGDGFEDGLEVLLNTDPLDPAESPIQGKLTALDSSADDLFGFSVSISGDTAVVGAYAESDNGINSGAAYVFERTGLQWAQQAKLTASDAAALEYFGYSVSVSGDTAFIGAHAQGGGGPGSVYVFERLGIAWVEKARLAASDAAAGDRFGWSVSVSGDSALVGAPQDDDAGTSSGSAYAFVRAGGVWTEQAKLVAGDASSGDEFGTSVSISGERALIGAASDGHAGASSGSAYVFARAAGSTWTEEDKLTANDASAGDVFGVSVALLGNTALIGARGNDDAGESSGSAYVFEYAAGSWSQQPKLTAGNAAAGDWFGLSVALSGDTAVIGARNADAEAGSAYVFRRIAGIWTELDALTAGDAAAGDRFGVSVSVDGDTALVGAYQNGANAGSAYPFDLDLDDDGLLNAVETDTGVFVGSSDTGTDFLAPDSDGDGLLDGFEVTHGFDPVTAGEESLDGDGDGLDNLAEQSAGTDPNAADTDGDGFDDDLELGLGSDPVDFADNPIQRKLRAGDGAGGDEFGQSVSISGDTALIGARSDDDGGLDAGAAYVFVRSGDVWTEQAKLVAADAEADGAFGVSVFVAGDDALIGADGDGGSGAAYVFTRTGSSWAEQAKLTAFDSASGDRFGISVSLSGETALVGARNDNSETGSAYVFTRTGSVWTHQAKLTANDGAAGDRFGRRVSLSGETALVGAYADDDAGNSSGAAYVFLRTSGLLWNQQAKLVASDGAADDRFGISVSLDGDTALVGAYFDDDGGAESGSAYVFVRTGTQWTEQAKLAAGDASAGDEFGLSVHLEGDLALVGAGGDDDGAPDAGSAYLFIRTGTVWVEQLELTANDAATGDEFGQGVSLSGDTALIGAFRDDDAGDVSGGAYAFDLDLDDDGLLNEVETDTGIFVDASDTGTDPLLPDTDGDGLLDAFEVAHGFDPTTPGEQNLDGDGDGLDNLSEQAAGTDPGDPDTDGDGFSDGLELSVGTDPLDAADNPLQGKLTASDAAVNDRFGWSVSISGDTALVGADNDEVGGVTTGSAYVFIRTGSVWSEQAKLIASDAASGDEFGGSVSISGDTAVVGALSDDDGATGAGAAYVFTRAGSIWTEQQKLTASDPGAFAFFGRSVSVSGDTALIGSDGDADAGTNSGSAYVFTRTGTVWSEQAKLTASDAAAGDAFGASVAISGDSGVVGAYGDDDGGTFSGSAYVFTRTGTLWSEEGKITASDAAAGDTFGISVAISGDTALIGASGDGDSGVASGSAYVFIRSGGVWSEQDKLTAADGAAGDLFGDRVALDGNTALVGAYEDWPGGSAYLFTGAAGTWTQQTKLTASDGALDDLFGWSVAIAGDIALIGARGDDDGGSGSGSAYPFDLDLDDDGLLNVVETGTGIFVDASDTGTDPLAPDSDGDGLWDGDEVAIGTSPVDPDTDGDGLTDPEEILLTTDPLDPDTDGDGVSDGDEVANGTDPLNPPPAVPALGTIGTWLLSAGLIAVGMRRSRIGSGCGASIAGHSDDGCDSVSGSERL